MSKSIKYTAFTNCYPYSGGIQYQVSTTTINYVFPVMPGYTYTIVMTEIGNRLRSVFTQSDPRRATANLTATDIVMNPTFDVGYTFSYKPTSYGYITVYVSNAGEMPVIDVVTDAPYDMNVDCSEVTSATTLTSGIFARAGDLILATVTTRSDTTFPDDWEIVRRSTVLSGSYSSQRMTFLYKKVTSDGVQTITVNQASSARIYINLIAFYDMSKVIYHEGTEVYKNAEETNITVNKPDYKNVVWGCTANLWSGGSWTCAQIPIAVVDSKVSTAPRQANFIDNEDAGKRVFAMGSSATSAYVIDCVELIDHVIQYATEGSAEYKLGPMKHVTCLSKSKISWNQDIPNDSCSCCVKMKIGNGQYYECVNGDCFPCVNAGDDISAEQVTVLVTLSTNDTSVSPSISDIVLSAQDISNDKVVVIKFAEGNVNSVQNACGDISVAYAGGTLAGIGGAVAPFEMSFTPEGLLAKNNPHDAEHIEISSIQASSRLARIYYHNVKAMEHIDISNIEAVGNLIRVDDI